MAEPLKPLVLMCSTPVSGHIIPMLAIARQLVKRKYDVCFVSGSGYREQAEATGASFVPVEGYGDFYDLTSWDLDADWPAGQKHMEGPACFNHDLIHIFCKSLPSQYAAIQRALSMFMLNRQSPPRPIIVMTESLNFGALPIILGAPGLRPSGFIAIGLNPILLTSIDHSPFGTGMLPDRSPEGRARNKVANAAQKQTFAESQAHFAEALASVGAKSPEAFLLDSLYSLPDRFVQMCAPSVEYLRTDAPATLRFAGGYPRTQVSSSRGTGDQPERPSWWHEITSDPTKKIVFVCQGTVAMDFSQLVVPTMAALADRSDVLVIVALGRPGTSLPVDVDIPSNCRVAEYIPYDDLLPHSDVFVTTGGYGSFQRALLHGTPLVMAGTTEEKPETAARAEWAGVAVSLRTSHPSTGQLREAVDEILGNTDKYKARALEIKAEIAMYDPVGVIVDNIEELAAEKGEAHEKEEEGVRDAQNVATHLPLETRVEA
ncbi:UDP-glucosyltransferase B1 [Apiospora saccharicola]